jgi:hypothetical protein
LRTKTVELFSGTLHRPGISYAANKLLADAGSADGFKADKMANITEWIRVKYSKFYFAAVNFGMEVRQMDFISCLLFVQTDDKHFQSAYETFGGGMVKSMNFLGSFRFIRRDGLLPNNSARLGHIIALDILSFCLGRFRIGQNLGKFM